MALCASDIAAPDRTGASTEHAGHSGCAEAADDAGVARLAGPIHVCVGHDGSCVATPPALAAGRANTVLVLAAITAGRAGVPASALRSDVTPRRTYDGPAPSLTPTRFSRILRV